MRIGPILGEFLRKSSPIQLHLLLCVFRVVGLGLAYAGSNRSEVLDLLLPVLSEANAPMELVGLAALSCGLIAVGAKTFDVTSAVLQCLMEKTPEDLKDPFAKFLPLALGLCFLG